MKSISNGLEMNNLENNSFRIYVSTIKRLALTCKNHIRPYNRPVTQVRGANK